MATSLAVWEPISSTTSAPDSRSYLAEPERTNHHRQFLVTCTRSPELIASRGLTSINESSSAIPSTFNHVQIGGQVVTFRIPVAYPVEPFSYDFTWTVEHVSTLMAPPVTVRPQTPPLSKWRGRLEAIRAWEGEPYARGTERIAPFAIDLAEQIALFAEDRIRVEHSTLETVMAPAGGGGLHMQWTARGKTTTHLEIGVPSSQPTRFEMLRTEEREDGTLLSSSEVGDALMSEVIAALEYVVKRSQKLKQHE